MTVEIKASWQLGCNIHGILAEVSSEDSQRQTEFIDIKMPSEIVCEVNWGLPYDAAQEHRITHPECFDV